MVSDPVRVLGGLWLTLVVSGCATMSDAPAMPPAGVFSAAATLPIAGTRWVVKETAHNENTRKTDTQTVTWTVLGQGTHAGEPVAILWDGTNIHVHDAGSGGWIALLDTDGRELVSYVPHEGQLSSPLWVGKSWVARSTWRSRIHGRTVYDIVVVWKVAAYEDVDVPAGRFRAFRLDAWPDERGQIRKRTDWYAPDLRLVVKSITTGFGTPYRVGVGSDRMKYVTELVDHATPAEAAARGDASYGRVAAARALISLGAGAPDVASALLEALDSAGTAPAPSGVPAPSTAAQAALLTDVSDDVRARAVAALTPLAASAPQAAAALSRLIRHPDTRLSTIWLIASLAGSPQNAVAVLREILTTETNTTLRTVVLDAIRQLSEPGK